MKADANHCIYAVGRKGWQNHSSMCWWPWIPPLYRHQGDSPTPSGWNSPILRRLYPPKCLIFDSKHGLWKHFVCFSSFLYHTFCFSLDISWTKKTRRTKTRKSMWKTSCQQKLPLMPLSTPCKLPCFFSDWRLCRVLGLLSCFLFNSLIISNL